MTGWSVLVTESAEHDLAEAALYLKDRLGSPKAALHLLDKFEDCVAGLARNPEAHPLVRDVRVARLGYRWVPVGNYTGWC